MECECKEWLQTAIDYDTVDNAGNPIILKNVLVEFCPQCNDIRINIDEITRKEQMHLADEYKLKPRQIPILLFMHAKGPRFAEKQPIKQKYTFNKMLFYLFKKLEEQGFERSFLHDQIECLERGPVPVNLENDAKELAEKGLIDLQEGGKRQKQPYIYRLTDEGKKLTNELWSRTPKLVTDTITKVKQDLLLLDSTELMNKVHKEYPTYRYTEEDTE